jgi:acyl-CoA reductase-like NAD-dependent aldehyde dehydrogenase
VDYEIDLWINNAHVKTNQYRDVSDPGRLTDQVGRVAQGEAWHVDQAVRSAHEAYQSWQKKDVQERAQLLLLAADVLEKEAEQLAPITTRESGMLVKDILAEIPLAANEIRFTVENAKRIYEPIEAEDENTWVKLIKKPLGVVVALVPWNVPYTITMVKLSSALITGNTLVVKPSPYSSIGLSLALQKMAQVFPPGVINVIHGEADVGAALVTHPLVRKITLTGGGKTAKRIMKLAAESLTRVHFELGGNDPAILLDDVNLEEAIPKIVRGVFYRSGQVCIAIKRVYVPQTLFQKACDLFCQYVDQFKIGHGLDKQATFAPVNNNHQYQYVKSLINKAKQSGAKVLELGTRLHPEEWDNGYYIHPTVVIDPDPAHEVVVEEQFGPVIPIVPYHSEEEVIQWANQTEYGLGSSIWSTDIERAVQVAERLEAGRTSINGGQHSRLGHLYLPFGGVKQSGMGWERSVAGLLEYINYQGITVHK